MTQIRNKSSRIEGIQAMRALASCMVLFFHICAISQFDEYSDIQRTKILSVFSNYWAGVDLFFCISGFIIFYSYSRKKLEISSFLKGRVVRIIPSYYLVTTITIIGYLYDKANSELSISHIIRSYSLLVNLENGNPILAVGWSLQFEFLFYLLFCSIYVRKRKFNFVFFSAGILMFTLIPGIGLLFVEFFLGALAFILSEKIIWNPFVIRTLIFAILVGIGIELHYLSSFQLHTYRILVLGVPFAFLVLLCSKLESVHPQIIRVGDLSFSLYLTHTFSMTLIIKILEKTNTDLSFVVFLITVIICIISSHLFWKYIELPITENLKRKIIK